MGVNSFSNLAYQMCKNWKSWIISKNEQFSCVFFSLCFSLFMFIPCVITCWKKKIKFLVKFIILFFTFGPVIMTIFKVNPVSIYEMSIWIWLCHYGFSVLLKVIHSIGIHYASKTSSRDAWGRKGDLLAAIGKVAIKNNGKETGHGDR
jgi:hypothetical protein